jgi:phage tail-like protein
MPRRINDPFVNFNFLVETGGILAAGFSEVTGMNAEIQAVEYRQGDYIQHNTHKLPGLAKYGNVTLKKGVAISQDFYDWFKSGVDGDIQRIDLSILLLDEQRQEKVRYNLSSAWPVKFVGPDLKAAANEIAIQSLEIAHEGLRIG